MIEGIIQHIPHASTRIPDYASYLRPDLIQGEVDKLTDWYTDQIFHFPALVTLQAEFSRVYCDVERYYPDALEPMATQGMGFYYTHTDDLTLFRQTEGFHDSVYQNAYLPHHQRLQQFVQAKLQRVGFALIIDCHSFADQPFLRDTNQSSARPDICLGTVPGHTPDYVWQTVLQYFESHGYRVGLNDPYSGSMLPYQLETLPKKNSVYTLMIELNRKLYLNQTQPIPGAIEKLNELICQAYWSLAKGGL